MPTTKPKPKPRRTPTPSRKKTTKRKTATKTPAKRKPVTKRKTPTKPATKRKTPAKTATKRKTPAKTAKTTKTPAATSVDPIDARDITLRDEDLHLLPGAVAGRALVTKSMPYTVTNMFVSEVDTALLRTATNLVTGALCFLDSKATKLQPVHLSCALKSLNPEVGKAFQRAADAPTAPTWFTVARLQAAIDGVLTYDDQVVVFSKEFLAALAAVVQAAGIRTLNRVKAGVKTKLTRISPLQHQRAIDEDPAVSPLSKMW